MKTLLYIGGALVVLLAVVGLGGAGSLPYLSILIVGGLIYLYFK